MKNLILAALLLLSVSANAQFSLGIKGGVNSPVNQAKDIIVNTADTSFRLGVEGARWGAQFGGWVRIGKGLFVQPEVLFNSTRTDYRIGETGPAQLIFTERYNNLDIPLLIGDSLGPLNIHAGPVGHYFLSSRSELTDVEGYEARFDDLTWGWTVGAGLGLGRLSADVRYMSSFRKQGSHLTFGGREFSFSNNPARVVINVNYRLFGL